MQQELQAQQEQVLLQEELEILVSQELQAQQEQVLLQEELEILVSQELQAQLEMQQCLQWQAEQEILA